MHIDLADIAAMATALGVVVAAYQLRAGSKQAQSQFEDSLTREYRQLVSTLPVEVLLDDELGPAEIRTIVEKHRSTFYRYIDLSNEQVFLRHERRISSRTWTNWQDGIRHNFRRRAFDTAWVDLKRRAPTDFHELRALARHDFDYDPGRLSLRLKRRLKGWFAKEEPRERETVRVSDISGEKIPDGKGATLRIYFRDVHKAVRELDVTDEEAENLGGRPT